jgi:threonine synthase
MAARQEMAHLEGLLACPEGAATLAGLRLLLQAGWVRKTETVVLFNTGAGLKYI